MCSWRVTENPPNPFGFICKKGLCFATPFVHVRVGPSLHETAALAEEFLGHLMVTSSERSDEAMAALRTERELCPSQRDVNSLEPLISLIEDDALLRSLLIEWLTADGYRVVANDSDNGAPEVGTVTSATVAQAGAQLVIVDVFMPRGPGIERLRLTRLAHPRVPIMAISGQFNPRVDAAGAAAAELDVDCVVAKPFEREVLIDAVRSLIGRPR